MKNLKFQISHLGKTYYVYIERNVSHHFKSKRAARSWIEKYKATIHDSVLILSTINVQIDSLYGLYYAHISDYEIEQYNQHCTDFRKSYALIYSTHKSYVQFNQINTSFYLLHQKQNLLKIWAQKSKTKILLAQIYPWSKTLDLVERTYNKEIKGITSGVNYRTELKTISKTPQNDQRKYNINRQFA